MLFTFNTTILSVNVLFAGHYCVANIAIQCPAGTYGPKEGLQRERDCAICPAGTNIVLQLYLFLVISVFILPEDLFANVTIKQYNIA